MLVIVSDLHLTDGTSGQTIKAGAFKVFRERLRDLAYDASWRADGTYRPIEQLDLVLLGDILDVIRSTKWLDGRVRPWSNANSKPFHDKVAAITKAVLQHNRESLALLKSLRSPDVLTIPEATTRGKPKRVKHDPDASGRRPVNVAIHYLVGNHDWFFHLRGKRADALRRNVVERMGLANSATEPFPHDPDESPVVRELFRQHQVLARHGDIFDPFNYEGDRDASSLGDAIVVELLNRFPAVIEDQLGNVLPRPCLDGLREVDNVRPLLVVPAWVDGLLRRTCPDPQTAKRVKAVWDQLADEFLRLDFVRQRDKWFQFNDLVDKLEWALKFSRGVSIRTLDRMLALWQRFFDRDGQSFHQHAFGEQAFKSRTARHIVYGHTHRHEIMPLDSCLMPGGLYEQMYLNSGTWRRVHELARWQPAEQEFQSYYVMTYLAFFKDGERGGRSFESWSGGLG